MKRIFNHPKPSTQELSGPKYWKSLDEAAETPEFKAWLHQEFPAGAAQLDNTQNPVDRRHFLKIMAASFGLAGLSLAGCRQPKEHILPYAQQPERVVPGVANFFASSFPLSYGNIPIIVESYQNRPTKIEGNPSYKPYKGSTDAFTQASILSLYDPDRSPSSRDVITQREFTSQEAKDLLKNIHDAYAPKKGVGLGILAEPSTSPTRAKLVKKIQALYPEAKWCEYTPINFNNTQKGYTKAYQSNIRPIYHFDKAYRVLAIDADFLHTEADHLRHSRDFTSLRKLKSTQDVKTLNRLYSVESNFTLSGGMADHRLRLSTQDMPLFTALIAAHILKLKNGPQDLIQTLLEKSRNLDIDKAWVEECAKDLVQNTGSCIVIGGYHLDVHTHALIALINYYLESNDNTISFITPPQEALPIDFLASALEAKTISTLLILGGNPSYNAPSGLDWDRLLEDVPQVIRFGTSLDESSQRSHIHIAASHYLESWSDGYTWDGTLVPIQPLIAPLYDTLSELDLLSCLIQEEKESYAQVVETFQELAPGASFEAFLAQGVANSTPVTLPATIHLEEITDSIFAIVTPSGNTSLNKLEVRLVPSLQVWDGSYSNNAWLQECPEPLNKTTWDNLICISPRLAKELEESTGVPLFPESTLLNKTDQLSSTLNTFKKGKEKSWIAELVLNGKSIKGPLHIQPGLATHTVVITLGYGRTHAGRVGNHVGFNAFPLLEKEGAYTFSNAQLKILEDQMLIANTQEHWSMEGRAIIREATSQDYALHPDFVKHMCLESHTPAVYGSAKDLPLHQKATQIPRGGSSYQTPAFGGEQQWGMSIDLNSCTGCNACVIACQSENNIPTIGKEQVLRGREMHWIRLDRYYSTGHADKTSLPEDPQVAFMSMLCQHCELAPCEMVCPVNATVHDNEGLNVMAYNRCVGTRYCANNCPYKVRRFNFFDWNKRHEDHYYEGPFGPSGVEETLKMQKNPNVTLRMRGVMEKCTYCVQRIEEAKITQRNRAKDSNTVKVPDGSIQTACQQACPTEAIVFGDIADPNSKVSKLKNLDRDYGVLSYLNTRPRTTYLARIRNPNPLMPDYYEQPLSKIEYEHRNGHHAETSVHHS